MFFAFMMSDGDFGFGIEIANGTFVNIGNAQKYFSAWGTCGRAKDQCGTAFGFSMFLFGFESTRWAFFNF